MNVIHGSRPITIVTETEAGSSRPSNSDFRDSSDFKFRHLWEPSVSKPQKDVGANLSEEIEVSVVFFVVNLLMCMLLLHLKPGLSVTIDALIAALRQDRS